MDMPAMRSSRKTRNIDLGVKESGATNLVARRPRYFREHNSPRNREGPGGIAEESNSLESDGISGDDFGIVVARKGNRTLE